MPEQHYERLLASRDRKPVAETIFCRKGFAESVWIAYLAYDILMNFINAH